MIEIKNCSKAFGKIQAVNKVTMDIGEREVFGLIGSNGAGKSTLLKVIAGVFKPTEGKVVRNGRLVPLLELGAGFDSQYTGRENIFLYGAMLGYSKKFLESNLMRSLSFLN